MTQQPPPGNYPPPPGGYPPISGGVYQQPGGTQPNNHLVWAILTTLFCCLPLGIVSIVKSAQVSGLWAGGRYADAQQAADSAKKWAIWSAVIGVIAFVIYGILIAAGAVSMDMDTSSA
jgi:hypothetical protein